MLSYGPQGYPPNNLTYKLRSSGREVINNACICPHSDMTSLETITDRGDLFCQTVITVGGLPHLPPIHGGYPSPPRILPPYMTF